LIEKPFGTDLKTAQELNAELRSIFDELVQRDYIHIPKMASTCYVDLFNLYENSDEDFKKSIIDLSGKVATPTQ
jgi:hypothetical protein